MINKKEKVIKRNYGIDLLRIISMINIINLHINLFSGQLSLKFNSPKYKQILRLQAFSCWSVNGFGLISGIVGYKRYKFSNLMYIWFLVSFYSVSISLYLYFINEEKTKMSLILSFFPILIKRHWYVNAYFSMYLLLPFINDGIKSLNNKIYRNLIIFFICFYSIYNIFAIILGKKNTFFLLRGYSGMWLTLLYIIGAYLGKYIIEIENKLNAFHYIFYISIYICSSFISSETHFKLLTIKSKIPNKILINYLSPTMILQAISLIMFFSKLKIQNQKLAKIISFLTPLNFSAQLIHSRLFRTKLKTKIMLFKWVNSYNNNKIFFKIYGTSIIIYLLCIFIDYFRLILFKLTKIRELCLFIERKAPQFIDNLILNKSK